MARQRPVFFSWRQAILKSGLRATTKHVLLTLSCHMNDAGESCYPSIDLLCQETSLSKRAVITHLQLALNAGWIGVRVHGFSGRSWARNEYHIKWPDSADGWDSFKDDEVVHQVHRPSNEVVHEVHHPGNEAVNVVHHPNNEVVHVVPRGGARGASLLTRVPHSSTSVITNTSSPDEVGSSPDCCVTKRKRKLTGWKLEGFRRFWRIFNFKHGRAEAADAWLDIENLTPETIEQILQAAAVEATRRPALVARGGSPKWAQGWLSARRFEDEALQPAPPKGTQSSAPDENVAKAKRHGIERLNELLKAQGKSIPPCSGGDSDA